MCLRAGSSPSLLSFLRRAPGFIDQPSRSSFFEQCWLSLTAPRASRRPSPASPRCAAFFDLLLWTSGGEPPTFVERGAVHAVRRRRSDRTVAVPLLANASLEGDHPLSGTSPSHRISVEKANAVPSSMFAQAPPTLGYASLSACAIWSATGGGFCAGTIDAGGALDPTRDSSDCSDSANRSSSSSSKPSDTACCCVGGGGGGGAARVRLGTRAAIDETAASQSLQIRVSNSSTESWTGSSTTLP